MPQPPLHLTTTTPSSFFVCLFFFSFFLYFKPVFRDPIFCTLCSILYLFGCILCQMGYSDPNKDVETARYAKDGMIKLVGFFGSLISTVHAAGTFNEWW